MILGLQLEGDVKGELNNLLLESPGHVPHSAADIESKGRQ